MTNSRLIWQDSTIKIKKYTYRINLYAQIIFFNFLLFVFIIGFIISTNWFLLLLAALCFFVDILIIKGGKIIPLSIYSDQVLFSKTHHDSQGNVVSKKRIVRYDEIGKIGELESVEPSKSLKIIQGEDAPTQKFSIYLQNGEVITFYNDYINDIETAHLHLKSQFGKKHQG